MKDNFEKYIYRYLFGAAVIAVATGIIVYHFVEHLSWLDAYYFSIITLATVGYGDITPHTTAGKIFTTIYIMFGIGIITTFLSMRTKRRSEKIAKKRQKISSRS